MFWFFFLLWQICGPIYLKIKYWPESFVKENNNQKTNFLIARHNIPIIDLKEFANSEAGINSGFDNFYEFEKKLPKKNITWIIGDGGAFKSLPRIICLKKNNHKFFDQGKKK